MVKLASLSFFVMLSFGACAAQLSFQDLMQLPTRIFLKIAKLNSEIKRNENITSVCKDSLSAMKNGISDPMKSRWAMEMMDAMGKLPAGIMQFSFSFVGSYDQCLSVDASNVNQPFRGQFCTLGIGYKNKTTPNSAGAGYMLGLDKVASGKYGENPMLQPQWDVCFPSTCTPEEVLITMNTVVDSLDLPLKFTMKNCDVKEKTKLDNAQITSIVIFSLLGLLLFLGTLIDLAVIVMRKLQPHKNVDIAQGNAYKFLLPFSLYNNAKKMLNTKTSSENLGAINGIRFLSMTWIILGHTYAFINILLIGNMAVVGSYFRDFEFQVIINGTVSVDVFFFLSGLLLAYISMKEVKKRGKMNWSLFYFHRFWRLTPALALVILSIFLMPLLGSGPYWKTSWEKQVDDCKTNWWTSLLYINNFVRMNDMCVIHGWYLANDMQFFVLSPLILYFLFRWRIVGLIVNGVFMLVTMVTPAILLMERGYPPTIIPGQIFESGNTLEYMQNIYMKPYCRMSTYCIGIYVGFMLASKKRFKIHPIVQSILWSLSIAASVAVVYGTYEWNRGNPSPRQVNALFVATSRPAFTLGIAWMTYACCTGYGGIVNRILSWKAFIPLGRMTFMAYLFHPYIMYILNFSLRERIIVTQYYMVVTFLGFLVISYGVSFVASICFETPLLNLEKILLRKPTQHSQPAANGEAKVNGEMVITNGGNENPAFKSDVEKF